MNRKLKAVLIVTGSVLTLAASLIFLMVYGAINYTRRCAHIAEKQGIACEAGGTLYIDDLAYFSNYDERRITGITGGEGIISDDGMSVTITKADGFATVYVYADNDKAPESTEHEIKVMIKDS
jgi:hypothetical protein